MTYSKIFSARAGLRAIFFAALIIFSATTNFAKAAAATTDNFDDAEMRFICAICSLGAYDDEESLLMRSMLYARGWTIEKISNQTNRAYAKGYLVSKGDTKILAIAGTENLKDIEINFRVGRVHLYDDTTLAIDEKKSGDKIFVHRGFRDYADVILGDGLGDRLKTSLKQNPNEKLYLTGHSLGGSVAIVTALRLADAGFGKDRVKVISFGAPAVGSRALANVYTDKIDLTRVEMRGDVVKKSLRVLGYVHFGKAVTYKQNITDDHFEHKMAVYLDCAIRDYYAAGGSLRHEAQDRIDTPIYVAPVLLLKGSFRKSDMELILLAIDDSLTNHFSNLTFPDTRYIELKEKKLADADFDPFVAAAKEHNCKYVLVRVMRAKKIRDAPLGDRRVTLEEFILDSNGLMLSMQTSGASTENLTLFEGAFSVQESLNDNLKNFFTAH